MLRPGASANYIIMSFVKCRNAGLSRVPEQGEVAAVVIRSDDDGDNMTITNTAAQTVLYCTVLYRQYDQHHHGSPDLEP